MTAEAEVPVLTAGSWVVSESRTRVTFSVGNLGRLAHGALSCGWGEVDVDETGAPRRVVAELDLESLDTGIARRDADLRKRRFLDVDRHPTMTWTAGTFHRTDDGTWAAEGVLQVRGTSAPLPVRGVVEVLPEGWVRVRATGDLDRTAVGIRAPRFLVGRLVRIEVDAWLSRRPSG